MKCLLLCLWPCSKMLRSLQTLKSSTSTWSCLLVPAVAMTKGSCVTPRLLTPVLLRRPGICYCCHDATVLWFVSKWKKNNMQVTIFTVPSRQSFVHSFISIFTLFIFLKRSASESLQTLFFQLCGSCWWWSKPLICVDILLYLVVCVSFVSPYLFITHTPPRPPQFGPFGLRMPGGRPLLDYGINLFLL